MNLQEQITDASVKILSNPKIQGKIRQFGIELKHKVPITELMAVELPEGIKLYEADGKYQFHNLGKWIIYLMSVEDIEELKDARRN